MNAMSEPLIAIKDLTKSFGGVHALREVSLNIGVAEVHGLCGENGAGKSTLIKCLSGVEASDSGTVSMAGQPLRSGDIDAAERMGVAVIHQESVSFPDLDLVDNLFVGREIRRYGLLDRQSMEQQARSILQRLDVDVPDLRTPLRNFSAAQRRMIEVARALLQDCRLLIMDEPTASLSARETTTLLNLVKRLRDDGISILYVSHRLEEIDELCDQVTVLRDGRHITTSPASELTQDELIRCMVGREVETLTHRAEHDGKTDHVRLSVRDLSSTGRFGDVSFDVCEGEILGVGGLVGAGRSEVVRAIFGADSYEEGTVEVDGVPLPGQSILAAISAGIAFVPEDRQHQGLIPAMSVSENLSMTVLRSLTRRGLMSRHQERQQAIQLMERLAVRAAGPQVAVDTLSGGNQQKVLLGKWLATKPRLLILDEPTRGVDVGAKAEIHRLVRELTSQGMGTIVVSSDLPELLTLSDRIMVMCEGRVTGELDAAAASEEMVMRHAFPLTSEAAQ